MLIDFRQLFPKYGIKPKGVLHVGANVGEEAPVYDELGIKNVAWVEANPYIIEKLTINVEYYGHRVFNFAASDENGNVNLHESNNGSQSSSILELGTHKIAHPEVHYVRDIPVLMARIDCIFRKTDTPSDDRFNIDGLDFLNMDIQGAELKALRGMGGLLHQFKWAYLEVNKEELYKGCALVEDIDMYLLGFGFRRVETRWCGNTGWGDALYIKK
jgi:FkbM family methyltransferase